MISFFVMKGGRSDYPRTAAETATLLKTLWRTRYGTNTLAFCEDRSGEGVGVGVTYFVDGHLVRTYNLVDAVKPQVIDSVLRIYRVSLLDRVK